MTAAAKTLDADLDDPLGLAALEAELAWSTSGPLPYWLDGTDLGEFDAMSLPPPMSPVVPQPAPVLAESRVETLAEVGEKTEPRVDMAAQGSENRPSSSMNELMDLVNLVSMASSGMIPIPLPPPAPEPRAAEPPTDILAPVSEPALFGTSHVMNSEPSREASPSEPTAKMPVSVGVAVVPPSTPSTPSIEVSRAAAALPEPPQRRAASLQELAAARDCIVVEAGDRFWAVPLHAVVSLKPSPASPADIDVDIAEELGNVRPRPRSSRRWMLETTGLTFGVDGLRGPGTVDWTFAADDEGPTWMLAQADHRGETVGLIDLERWHRVEVIQDESEAAEFEPLAVPSATRPPTSEWLPG